MPVTSNQIISAILTSINTALTKTDLQNDERASLINQYEQTTEMVREGYQFSEADIFDLPAQISALADEALANSIANIQSQVDSEIQILQDWKGDFISNHSINDGELGSTHFNVATSFCKLNISGYAHVKLPIKVGLDFDMFHIALRGHAHGQSSIISSQFVGYAYGDAGITSFAVDGSDSPFVYESSDNFVVCRISLSSLYYLTLVVDSIYVGNGRSFAKGDITIEFNDLENI